MIDFLGFRLGMEFGLFIESLQLRAPAAVTLFGVPAEGSGGEKS
jgi:hypothetical protein